MTHFASVEDRNRMVLWISVVVLFTLAIIAL